MSFMKRVRVLFVCLVLQCGVLVGVPVRPDDVQELMNQLNQPKLANVLPSDSEGSDGHLPET